MRVSDFDFDLPPRFIAQRPAAPRDSARLLAVGREFRDLGVRDLPGLLAPGDVMVVNNTRVISARLGGKRSGGGRVEVTLIKPEGGGAWRALAKPAGKLKTGDRLSFAAGLSAEVAAKADGGQVTLRFPLADDELAATLEAHGIMPLPPYIKRPPAGDARDRDDYQTLFAERPGAVAAPTAGLHFTPALLKAIADREIGRASCRERVL